MRRGLKWLFVVGLCLSGFGFVRIGYYHLKAEIAQMMIASVWLDNQKLNLDSRPFQNKPWPWADTWPVLQLEFPSLATSSIVLKDASGESLAFGPGLMTPNILPGDIGNSFIAAHRDTHFSSIGLLKKDQFIRVTLRGGEIKLFKIDKIKIVDSRTEIPVIDSFERRMTLVTCYPFDGSIANTPYRYLVSGTLFASVD